jgi:hypothetical protein
MRNKNILFQEEALNCQLKLTIIYKLKTKVQRNTPLYFLSFENIFFLPILFVPLQLPVNTIRKMSFSLILAINLAFSFKFTAGVVHVMPKPFQNVKNPWEIKKRRMTIHTSFLMSENGTL